MSESVSIYKLGMTGRAYDMPGTCRAYTYRHQPDNVAAGRLGDACWSAYKAGGGDSIDFGLGLLKQLEANGFGVYELDEGKAPEVLQDAVPEETPHIIVFDDADRPNEMFSGAGARPAALRRWQQISVSWNAHLYVRVERNSRDDRYPCARLATQVNRIPAGLYAELEALRTLRDATRVYRDSYMRDEIEDEDSCVSVDQHDAACSVQAALESAQALEWKGVP